MVTAGQSRFSLQWFDFGSASAAEIDQIKQVYASVFKNDIGITFDASLDSDTTHPVKYYSRAVRGAFIVVRDNDHAQAIVGTCALRHIKELGNQAELKRMFFLPQCRGHKLAKKAAELIIAKAREFGFDAIVLDTKTKLTAANGLYEKLGFVDCENYNGNPRADRFMRLTLRPAIKAKL